MAKIAILGFGTVGSGVYEVLCRNAAGVSRRAGEPVEVKYILDPKDFSDHPAAKLFIKNFDAILEDPQPTSSGKMCREFCPPKTTHSAPSWEDYQDASPPSINQWEGGHTRVWLLDPSESSRGGRWTPSFSVWPSDGSASLCSLSEVLEVGAVPMRYYLSPTACKGILRRADKRGKDLPVALKSALEAVASQT